MERVDFGEPRQKAIYRTPSLKFKVVRWDWSLGKPKDKNALDITFAVINMQWMKSTRNPEAICELSIIPQKNDIHYLDIFNPMDVIQIYEFGILKYQGYIKRIGAKGSIKANGAPDRMVHITCSSFGSLFSESQLGVSVYIKMGTVNTIKANIEKFQATLADVIKSEKSYSELVKVVIDEWLSYLELNGATKYKNYFQYWINYVDGLAGKTIPGVPKDFYIFYGTEQSVSLWDILNKLVQAPFNELWFDCGPRKVWIENNSSLSGKPGEIKINDEKEYLVIRNPPFNGTVIDGAELNLWDSLPTRKIPFSYLTQFELNKTMEESNSFYMVSPAVYDPGIYGLIALGKYAFDDEAFNKYLYRPITHDLFFTRIQKQNSTDIDSKARDIYADAQDKAETLKNWFKLNDQYLSGAFTIMVPSNNEHDPRIGEKISFEGLDEYYFYVEGVSHSWSYGGPLISSISVTRGYGENKPIQLKDRMFRRGKFAMGENFL